jgi:hypothetical protein
MMPRPCREKLALDRDLRFGPVVLPHPNLVAFLGPEADIATGAATGGTIKKCVNEKGGVAFRLKV